MSLIRKILLAATVSLALVTLVVPSTGAYGADDQDERTRATIDTFTYGWVGHTRSLKIHDSRLGRELVYSGCCDKAVDLTIRISDPRGTTTYGTVQAQIVRVVTWDRFFGPRPHRGDITRLKLRSGVLTEPFVGITYCSRRQAATGTCGA